MGKDRRPPGSRNRFDDIGRAPPPSRHIEDRSSYEMIEIGGGKIMRPAEEVDPNHVQGCGDPECRICMPRDGRGGGARGGRGAITSMEVMKEAVEQMQRGSARDMMFSILGRSSPGEYRFIQGDPFVQREDDKSSRLRSDEKRLRGPVERYLLKTKHTLAWDDVIGNEAAREALVEAIEHPIKHAELYRYYGRKPTKGVLLYGPPGCGKTMFGKAAASTLAQLHGRETGERVMLHIKGPEIQSPYVGVTEETIRAVYAYARAYRALHGFPLVIFIDEADAILPSRDGAGAGGRRALPYEESLVAAFLAEMDGLEDCGAFTILATNRPEAIDAAILRDGRCDRKIKVERPNRATAEVILLKALAGTPLAPMMRKVERFHPGGMLPPELPHQEAIDPEKVSTILAADAAERVFAPDQVLHHLATDKGPQALRLADIVNGAMLVGIVEQAKAIAFRRDLSTGGAPTGLTARDLGAAIASVREQNRGLNHAAALNELAERIGFNAAAPLKEQAGSAPRYALAENGDVVRVQ